jgi:hypothetical protein
VVATDARSRISAAGNQPGWNYPIHRDGEARNAPA